jgi:predicted enzyme related to lactoylglutathione lyase
MSDNLGRFVWHDLMTTDAARSLDFYGQLFPEWAVEDLDVGEAGTYHMIHVDGLKCGGIVAIPEDAGIPSHWIGYVEVEDCDATVERVKEAAGSLVMPAHTAPGVGRFAVVADPVGAMVKPFQVEREVTLPTHPTSGNFVFDECLSNNVPATQRFYQSVFGWSLFETPMDGMGTYTLFRVGEQDTAGCLAMPPEAEGNPTWLTYLCAEDIDDRAAKAESLGAQTFVAPQDIPGVGRFSVHADSNNAFFALFRKGV